MGKESQVDDRGRAADDGRNSGRVGNLVGWSLAALLVGIAMSFVAEVLFIDVIDSMIDGVVPTPIQVIGTALLVGASMGAVIGSRVYLRPVVTTVIVMLVYSAVWPFALTSSLGFERSTAGTIGSALLHVGVALASATYLDRRGASKVKGGNPSGRPGSR